MGFFNVVDVPERRVVQYRRVTGGGDGVVFLEDESVLGDAKDAMPFADKTGIKVASGGSLYEVPYLDDAGPVYFAVQPEGGVLGAKGTTLTATPKAGKAPYKIQWYKDDQQVVNVPDSAGKLAVTEPGKYWAVVTDADGVEAVSQAADLTVAESE